MCSFSQSICSRITVSGESNQATVIRAAGLETDAVTTQPVEWSEISMVQEFLKSFNSFKVNDDCNDERCVSSGINSKYISYIDFPFSFFKMISIK